MAKPRQVQSCAYVGTLLSRQRLQARLKQRFFQIALNARFFQYDFRGSPEFPVSPPPPPPAKVPTRSPKAQTVCPNPESRGRGGGLFICWYGLLGRNTLWGLTEGSRGCFHTTGQKWRWEDEEATCRHTRGMPTPRGGEDILTHPSFPPLVNLARDRISVSPKGAGLPRARAGEASAGVVLPQFLGSLRVGGRDGAAGLASP